ncbi:MAG: hypothetical protein MJ086_02105 [Lachnospiraceae bacterium]|nr:hypothetical protein [Lachnospiraceae bacterium]
MENKLKNLFEYQRFEKNEKLEKLISQTESRFERELSEDDLFFVNAAGDYVSMDPEKFEGDNIWGEGQEGEIILPSGK